MTVSRSLIKRLAVARREAAKLPARADTLQDALAVFLKRACLRDGRRDAARRAGFAVQARVALEERVR